jgi:hypothetical protein
MAGYPIEQSGDSYRPDPDESPRGVNSVLPGVMSDAGSQDPASTSVAGAVAAAMAYTAEMRGDAESPRGDPIGDPINLPPLPYK